jgi:hypothetical protein
VANSGDADGARQVIREAERTLWSEVFLQVRLADVGQSPQDFLAQLDEVLSS